VTSLIWFLLDVFLLMYFTDCTNSREALADNCNSANSGTGRPGSPKPTPAPSRGPVANFFNRIIPDGITSCFIAYSVELLN